LELDDGVQNALLEQIVAKADQLSGARITTIDGLRAEYEDGWGLVRASENPPGLGFRFEADDDQALERVQDQYRTLLRSVWPDLQSPF
jgi:phosphomannomutase/phosphoglucomutase